jgi:hypothetical protein
MTTGGIMTPEQKIDAMNRNPIGTEVVYWPTLHRAGKRTKTRSAAFLSNSGTPVIFVEGVSGYVHVEHVEIGSLMPTDSPCFDNNFQHLWG